MHSASLFYYAVLVQEGKNSCRESCIACRLQSGTLLCMSQALSVGGFLRIDAGGQGTRIITGGEKKKTILQVASVFSQLSSKRKVRLTRSPVCLSV
jgi:hypothetical protein